ncbi:hypothetical protein CWO85_00515 [Candidatus Phytoplasma ziziphi]|uniref:Uncharacterized protein n=1 Tax=Ziziphus jujuba witches'-broom phytoplasma TaxID=135727 RepID=A0A660HLU2_ZIZJU|nr:hypothetical protein CWO85_00515 [Candidatus Phytoplasma ziziphi]
MLPVTAIAISFMWYLAKQDYLNFLFSPKTTKPNITILSAKLIIFYIIILIHFYKKLKIKKDLFLLSDQINSFIKKYNLYHSIFY